MCFWLDYFLMVQVFDDALFCIGSIAVRVFLDCIFY